MSLFNYGLSVAISESITKTVNESISETMLSNTGSCNSSNVVSLNQSISNLNTSNSNCNVKIGSMVQKADQNTKMSCIIKSSIDSSITEKVMKKIKEKLGKPDPGTAVNVGVVIGSSKSITEIQNIVKSTVDLKNISECIVNNSVDMDQVVKDIDFGCPKYCSNKNPNPLLILFNPDGCALKIDNMEQYGVQTVVSKCLFKNKIFNEKITELSIDLEKKINEEQAPKQTSMISSSICCSLVLSLGFAAAGMAAKDDPKMQLIIFGLLIVCICCSSSSSSGFAKSGVNPINLMG